LPQDRVLLRCIVSRSRPRLSSMCDEKDGEQCEGRAELLEREPARCQEEWGAAITAHAHRNVVVAFEVFAAIPGCWPGRALPTSGCPQPGRPRSGCAPLAVRYAAVTCSSAHTRSTSRRGRQRLHRNGYPSSHRTPPTTNSDSFHQQPTLGSTHQKPSRGRDSPACNSTRSPAQRAPAGT